LGYRANDQAALKLKSDAETGQSNVAARAEREANYQKAMAAGNEALKNEDFTSALKQAGVALGYRANDPAALKLKTDAETGQRNLAAQAEREANYLKAMTEATNAWRRAESASKQTNYDVAVAEVTTALNQCKDAEKLKPGESASQLKLELEKLLGVVRTAKGEIDFDKAQSLKQSGKVDEALQICQGYLGNDKFEALRKNLSEMQAAYSAADAKLVKGEYDYLGTLKSSGFDTNPFFAQLVEAGRREGEQLSSLTKLKEDNQRLKLKDQLQALPKSVAAKKPFQELQIWVDVNDPIKRIKEEILILRIQLGVDKKSVRKDADGRRIEQLPTGADVEPYRTNVDDIIKRLGGRGSQLYKDNKKDLDSIVEAINNWR
jgi:hypothetical protein